jgi:gliding motility-associated-like protein
VILHPCYEVTDIFVYNRWGQTLFSYRATGSTSWNGTLNGQIQPIETYTYYIRAKCSERNTEEVYKGNVTLLR